MNGNKEIGLNPSGFLHSSTEWNELVITTGKHRRHSRLSIDDRLKLSRNCKGHTLFIRSARADGAEISPSLAIIERNRDFSFAIGPTSWGTFAGGEGPIGTFGADQR